MQIYTNFESNSQHSLEAVIHLLIVSDANLHKFWKQFTTFKIVFHFSLQLFPMQIYTNFESNSQQRPPESNSVAYCFRCKFTQILKAIHNPSTPPEPSSKIVSDANLHKFWKQFTTSARGTWTRGTLFPMQIYTNFESNSQLARHLSRKYENCFRCKFTQILKAIHNTNSDSHSDVPIVSDANLHKFWKQFTTGNIFIGFTT